MKALVLTSNGMKHGVITGVTTNLVDGKATATVRVGEKDQSYAPEQIFSTETSLNGDTLPSYPCVFVGKRDYKQISSYRPRVRKTRAPRKTSK